MKIDIPDISKQIYKQDVLNVIESGYSIIGPLWTNNQLEWLNNSYKTFIGTSPIRTDSTNYHRRIIVRIFVCPGRCRTATFCFKPFC